MAENKHDLKEQVRELIYNTCIHLDDHQWEHWHDNCADNFNYAIRAFSPEVQADIKYHGGDKEYMQSITSMLSKHNSDQSPLRRHCTVYRVEIAADGKSAITTFGDGNWDLVFCDIKMPYVDGIEVLEHMMSVNAEVPVIMISGHGDINTAVDLSLIHI